MNDNEIQRLALAVNSLRPEWPVKSLRTFLAGKLAPRPYQDVALALVFVATDPKTTTPARVLEAGPWWKTNPAGNESTYRPPRPDEECVLHVGEYRDSCRACAADRAVRDATPKRAEGVPGGEHIERMRAELTAARATKCACGVERRFCNDHRETESEAS